MTATAGTTPMLVERGAGERAVSLVSDRAPTDLPAPETMRLAECRTQATDEDARHGFLRYWRPLSPFIGVVLRAQLGVIEDEAAAGQSRTGA